MSGVDRGRRRFLAGLLRERVLAPLTQGEARVRADARRERLEEAYESELRAFGPDVLADAARRTGLAATAADYAAVAKVLAGDTAGADDERS